MSTYFRYNAAQCTLRKHSSPRALLEQPEDGVLREVDGPVGRDVELLEAGQRVGGEDVRHVRVRHPDVLQRQPPQLLRSLDLNTNIFLVLFVSKFNLEFCQWYPS